MRPRYVDTFNPARVYPYERRLAPRHGDSALAWPTVYRYPTAEGRADHLKLEAAVLEGRA